jgi:hypothetical protein
MLQKILLNPSQITCSANYNIIDSLDSTYEAFWAIDNTEQMSPITFHFENSYSIQQIKIITKNSRHTKLNISYLLPDRDTWVHEKNVFLNTNFKYSKDIAIFKCNITCRKIKICLLNTENKIIEPFKIILYKQEYPRYNIFNTHNGYDKKLIYNPYIDYQHINSLNLTKQKYKINNPKRQNNILNEKILEGTTALVCIKNRTSHLIKNISSWLSSGVDELIIVDWCSDESLLPILKKLNNDKIRYVRVENETSYIRSYAQNLGAKFCRYDKILKLDADINIIDEKFLDKHTIKPGEFYVSDYLCARDDNEKFTHGIMYLDINDYFSINGYNEIIIDYGWDDSDFTSRLLLLGLHKKLFNLDTIYHVPHDNNTRVNHSTAKFHPYLLTELHKQCCLNSELWNNSFELQNFEIISKHKNYFICNRTTQAKYSWTPEVYQKSLEDASLMVFEWLKQPTPEHRSWIKEKKHQQILEYLSHIR